ncbi:uncharacterized protein PGTG_14443 [Puccinia graminis f. sp. tritici CRL 75-36-700-3]|uniref:Uncharacterized protein n=1 Tax=Puccinia graminis f. sp. tritici (strain CRL 75-36-700-3 / race SCCL) TaxID=418459 RepID=E3KVL9_PUCGT|nr:uncharacterized protein PGTG_14443 [Puccinia graminis f. sp. tritici CRL 75-36-700-3]EFP88359.1 hypothetical protein PGTG_14443 [Puccinia graminis f. sp. tritici CRL 75-36-700-3]
MDFSTLVLLSITIAMSGMQSTLVSATPVPQLYYPNRVGYPGPYGPGVGPGIYGNGVGPYGNGIYGRPGIYRRQVAPLPSTPGSMTMTTPMISVHPMMPQTGSAASTPGGQPIAGPGQPSAGPPSSKPMNTMIHTTNEPTDPTTKGPAGAQASPSTINQGVIGQSNSPTPVSPAEAAGKQITRREAPASPSPNPMPQSTPSTSSGPSGSPMMMGMGPQLTGQTLTPQTGQSQMMTPGMMPPSQMAAHGPMNGMMPPPAPSSAPGSMIGMMPTPPPPNGPSQIPPMAPGAGKPANVRREVSSASTPANATAPLELSANVAPVPHAAGAQGFPANTSSTSAPGSTLPLPKGPPSLASAPTSLSGPNGPARAVARRELSAAAAGTASPGNANPSALTATPPAGTPGQGYPSSMGQNPGGSSAYPATMSQYGSGLAPTPQTTGPSPYGPMKASSGGYPMMNGGSSPYSATPMGQMAGQSPYGSASMNPNSPGTPVVSIQYLPSASNAPQGSPQGASAPSGQAPSPPYAAGQPNSASRSPAAPQ